MVYAYFYDKQNCFPDLCSQLNIKYIKSEARLGQRGKIVQFLKTFLKYFLFYFEIRQKALLNIIDIDIDILNPHDYHIYPTAGMWKKKTNKPVVWMMNDMPMYRWKKEKLLKTCLFHLKPKFRNYIRSFDKIIVLDNINKLQVQQHFGLASEVVRSGIDINKFKYTEHSRKKDFSILSTGIFYSHRRIEDTIIALRILVEKGHDIRLHHIGVKDRDIKYAKKVFSLVEKFGLQERVHFHDRVSEQELIQSYSESDVFVFPNAPQTWGLSVFEAMSCGLPVILTTGCGASEVLRNGETAIIIEPMCPKRLADALEQLYNDQSLCQQLSRKGRKFVQNHLSWNKYSESMLEIFRKAIRNSD
ncbi:MAG: glycosyltransferase family 4 protein [Thermodesulfovibrionales bacterium]|nr:glycosyltransferase family 4 protein [Thermodesulfovibrionales bacterium]